MFVVDSESYVLVMVHGMQFSSKWYQNVLKKIISINQSIFFVITTVQTASTIAIFRCKIQGTTYTYIYLYTYIYIHIQLDIGIFIHIHT